MSVLIKGMEMPESCHECVAGYGGCCFVAPAEADGICPDHGRADFCPLVPVPKHGRLIDADALQKDGWAMQRTYQSAPSVMTVEMKYPADFPAIIEAEGGEYLAKTIGKSQDSHEIEGESDG